VTLKSLVILTVHFVASDTKSGALIVGRPNATKAACRTALLEEQRI
jgi:hypothetical protein